jgi:Ca2+-binding RTX toxin-like protein
MFIWLLTATVTVNPTIDTVVEANETVSLILASGTGYNIGTTTAVTGTIINNDAGIVPVITIQDTTIVEGSRGTPTKAYVVFSLDTTSVLPVSVNYATSNVSAIAGSDYTASTGTITFNPGETVRTIELLILNDNVNEVNETFNINLSTPVNGAIPDSKATIIVTDTLVTDFTRTLPTLVENLTLADGAGAINGIGNAGNNVLTGNGFNNILDGGAGADTLTGGAGNDTFNFQFGQSSGLAIDRITDLALGTEKIDLFTAAGIAANTPTAFSRASDNSTATTLAALTAAVYTDANGGLANNQGLALGGAALVVATGAGIAGTYLVIDDGIAGAGANDLVINITNFSGVLPSLGSLTASSFFV